MRNIALFGSLLALVSYSAVADDKPIDSNCEHTVGMKQLRSASNVNEAQKASRVIGDTYYGIATSLQITLGRDGTSPEAIAETCYLLSLFRIDSAIGALADRISFVQINKQEHQMPLWRSHPCREALVKIGKPAVPNMLELIRESDDREVRQLATLTLLQIEGPEVGQFVLTRAFDQALGPERKRLDEALGTSRSELDEVVERAIGRWLEKRSKPLT